ncbi:MAG: GDYXXLXY domain-containing protein [Candidatus Coatesbacteria bacterium]
MKWVRWTLLAQLLFFGGWAAREEWNRQGPVIVLETAPVDPRDLLSGQYLQLSYRISRLDGVRVTGDLPRNAGAAVAVRLVPAPDRPDGRTVWRAAEIACPGPAIPVRQDPAQGVWVTGRFTARRFGGGLGWVEYGIERYYFNEARVKEFASRRSGAFLVECTVGRDGRLAIRRLVE